MRERPCNEVKRERATSGLSLSLSLSFHASPLCISPRIEFLPPRVLVALSLPPRGGRSKNFGGTHWHTYRSFPFLRFEYHKTWGSASKAAQTAPSGLERSRSLRCELRDLGRRVYAKIEINLRFPALRKVSQYVPCHRKFYRSCLS